MASKRTTTSEIQVRMSGHGVMPETVDVRELAAAILAMDKAARAASETPENVRALSLLRVTKGSLRLHFAGTPPVQRAVESIIDCAVAHRLGELPAAVTTELASLTDKAERAGRKLTISAGGKTADLTGKHRPTPPAAPTLAPVRGGTTIFGRVYGVRLKDDGKAVIDLKLTDEGRRLPVGCSHRLAQDIAQHLGSEVGLDGDAEWNAATLELMSFTALRLTDFVGLGDVDEFLGEMSKLDFSSHDRDDDDENENENDEDEVRL